MLDICSCHLLTTRLLTTHLLTTRLLTTHFPLNVFALNSLNSDTAVLLYYTSVRPEVRGTADVGWRSLFPFRSILLVLTHDFIIICVYGPTGSDGHERKDADAALRTILVPFEAKGVLYTCGPVQPANGPPTRTTSGYAGDPPTDLCP